MGDDDQRAGVLDESDAQGLAHFEIQMVGRLIEQQQVGRLSNHQCQDQPRFLTAGERCDRLEDALTAEAEAAQVIAVILLAVVRRIVPQMIDGTALGPQQVELVLGKVPDLRVLAYMPLALEHRAAGRKGLDERRLARAVHTQQANTVAGQ